MCTKTSPSLIEFEQKNDIFNGEFGLEMFHIEYIVWGGFIQFELFHIEKLNIELFQVELFNLNCSIL